MANEVVGVDLVLKIDKFREELEKATAAGDKNAKALVASFSRELKKMEKDARDAASDAKELAKASKEAGESFGKAGQSASKLAGILELVGGADAARTLADIADVGEVAAESAGALGLSMGGMLALLGPVAAAVGIAAVAIGGWREHTEQAEQRAHDYAVALGEIERGMGDIKDALDELAVREGVLSGALGLEDAEFLRSQTAAEKTFAEERGKVIDELQKQQDRMAALRALSEKGDSGIGGMFSNILSGNTVEALSSETDTVGHHIKDLQSKLHDLDQEQGQYADRLTDVTTGERKQKEAVQDSAKATRDAAEAERKRVAALQALNDQLHDEEAAGKAQRATYDAAIAKLGDLAEADRQKMGTASERLAKEHEAALQDIEDLQRVALAASETATGRENAEAEALDAMKAENTRYAADVKKIHDDLYAGLVQKAQQAAAAQVAAQQAAWGSVSDEADAALSSVVSFFGEESAAGKAAAAAQILLGEIELLAKAASLGPAAPLYIAAGEVPLALAAAKLAGFGDTPGPIAVPEQGAAYTFAPRDIVVAGRTPEAVQRQVEGLGGGGGEPARTEVALRVGGRTSERIVVQAARARRGMGRRTPAGRKRRTS